MALDLAEFLQKAARKPFTWGGQDCCLFVADWLQAARAVDPASDLRGTYDSEKDAARIIAAEGGLRMLAIKRLAAIGLRAATRPIEGDIGIVETMAGETLAIKGARSNWVCKSQRGILVAPFKSLMAWSLIAGEPR